MKTFVAYDVNPRLLYKLLKESGQPLIGIKFDGPATRTVSYAVAAFTDKANEAVIAPIVARVSSSKPEVAKVLSGPKAKVVNLDARIEALKKQFV